MATPTGGSPATSRLMVLVCRLYHVHKVRQRDIGERLGISQARVSRLLRQAEEQGLVQTVVAVPEGLHPEVEEAVEAAYGISEVHAVEVADEQDVVRTLGRAAARYVVESGLAGGTVGFTSWSSTLQELAAALPELPRTGAAYVVEMLGDLGSPALQHDAARSTQAMARALGAQPVFLRTPGVLDNEVRRGTALADPHVQRVLSLLDDLDVAFVGVGPVEAHSMLTPDDNYFSEAQLALARTAGAVGQLDQRLIGPDGSPVSTPLDDLVVGVTLDQLRRARRRVVVAGGPSKLTAITAALAGGWVDVLVTDLPTATAIAEGASQPLPTTALAG